MDEFRRKVLKVNESRTHKVNNSYGVYDAYKFIRKHKWLDLPRRLTEKEFYSIIRKIGDYMAMELADGNDIRIPCQMGSLEIRKRNPRIYMEKGKVVTTLPVNWDRTLKLWAEDKESYDNKILVKEESDEIFRVYYNKSKATYNNKSFYVFHPNREIKRRLRDNIRRGMDAYGIR